MQRKRPLAFPNPMAFTGCADHPKCSNKLANTKKCTTDMTAHVNSLFFFNRLQRLPTKASPIPVLFQERYNVTGLANKAYAKGLRGARAGISGKQNNNRAS